MNTDKISIQHGDASALLSVSAAAKRHFQVMNPTRERGLELLEELIEYAKNLPVRKTALEWFEDLPEDVRNLAIENYKEGGIDESETFKSLRMALLRSFIWRDTDQGFGFWSNVRFKVPQKENAQK